MKRRIPCKSTAFLILLFTLAVSSSAMAQDEGDAAGELAGKVDGLSERTATLEASVMKLSQMKISGYVQPQWVWSNIDSLSTTQGATRNFFQIRRGRVKFTH